MTDERQIPRGERGTAIHPGPSAVEALLAPGTVLGFVMLGLALAVVLAAGPTKTQDDIAYFGLAALLIQWVVALSLGTVYLLRRPLRRLRLRWVLLLLAMIVIAVTMASGITGWVLLAGPEASRTALADFLARITIVALAMTGAGALIAISAARWQRTRTDLARAELARLQARVRPHFLFNTLNTAIALIRSRPGEAENVLLGLSELFRTALGDSRSHPLSRELEIVSLYLDIESKRLGSRLDVLLDLDAEAPDVDVPVLLLQSLAENAVHHGIEPSAAGGLVEVSSRVDGPMLRLRVANPLGAISATRRKGHGVGLSSARAGLALLYGDEARLERRIEGDRHIVEITLPLQATTR